MSYGRRITDRRRRVLYTSHQADGSHPAAGGGRVPDRLREARRPTAAYGSRVHRRLRGRWFSLVPVRRRSLWAVTLSLLALSAGLIALHHAAVSWPPIATAPAIARPLRLDRADSFGRWASCLLLAACSGASLMIYQLRRYKLDDYEGHYRIWRVVLIVTLLASINTLTAAVAWCGAILDAAIGQRVALAGGDWIRLVLTIGGLVLGLRLVAEVHRCRWSLVAMGLAWFALALPAASDWNIVEVDSLPKWTAVTSAPLLAHTFLLIALGGYLRMLYREVRQIEDGEPFTTRLRRLGKPWRRSDDRASEAQAAEKPTDEPRRAAEEPETVGDEAATRRRPRPRQRQDEKPDRPERRRWLRGKFSLGRRRPASDGDASGEAANPAPSQRRSTDHSEAKPAGEKKKRRRFSFRLAPPGSQLSGSSEEGATDEAGESPDEPQQRDDSAAPARRSRFRLAWKRRDGGRDRAQEAEATDTSSSAQKVPENPRSRHRGHDDAQAPPAEDEQRNRSASGSGQGTEDEVIDPDQVNWSSLSKADRRRLRKQLKRQNRAA